MPFANLILFLLTYLPKLSVLLFCRLSNDTCGDAALVDCRFPCALRRFSCRVSGKVDCCCGCPIVAVCKFDSFPTTKQRVANMDDWLVQKAKEKFEKEYQLKHGASMKAGEGKERKEKSKNSKATTTDYVFNHGIEDNPYLANYIDYEKFPV